MYIVTNIKCISIRLNIERNAPLRIAFRPVSKPCTNKFYIWRQCAYIVFAYIYLN